MSTFRATSMHSEAAAAIGEAPEDGDPRPARADSDRTSATGTRVRKGKSVNSTDGSTAWPVRTPSQSTTDRKSTRLNSSHGYISYAVFCLKKKKNLRTKVRTDMHSTDVISER